MVVRILQTGHYVVKQYARIEVGRAALRHSISTAQGQLINTVFSAAWAEGQQMTLDQAIKEAQALPPGG